ncbi:MAG: O-antigen ligase family protein [Hydrogenophilales bacterium]|nr:O-antigen ligase family protein [Hydrogenophilales bacterium]
MFTLQTVIYWGMLIGTPLILALGAITSGALAGRWARYLIYPYLGILIFFSGSEYGLLDDDASRRIYSRGSGVLYFPFVNLYLFWLAGIVGFHAIWNRLPAPKAEVRKYLLFFGLVFVAQIFVGLILDKSIFFILYKSGTMYLMNAIILVFVLLRAFRDEQAVNELLSFFMLCVFLRVCWGLIRFALLGGDDANYYANYEHLNIKLTFFDINDSILATMGAFLAAARLTDRDGLRQHPWKKLFLLTLLITATLVVILSYRRTAWTGYMLAGLAFLWLYRKKVSWPLVATVGSVALFGVFSLWTYRFAESSQGGLIGTLFPDMASGGKLTEDSGRLFELRLAMDTIRQHFLLGVGNWGEYEASSSKQVAFHRGRFFFMHSGFLHVWLKTGLVGLIPFIGALWVSSRDAVRLNATLESPVWQALAATGLAGILVSMPNMLGGTPIIEYRTMQVLGLMLALPYLARAAGLNPSTGKNNHAC